MSKVSETLHEASGAVTDKVGEAYATARDTASSAYAAARDVTGDAGLRAVRGFEANPLAVLAGGLALGAVAGVLIPASRREVEALGPLGGRLGDAAKTAFAAAKDAGKDTLDELGFSQDGAKEQISKLVDAALKTATAAGGAAAQSFKTPE